jgi:hypothetical protein
MALVSEAFLLAEASSTSTTALVSAAVTLSFVICTIIASTSACVLISFGSISRSVACNSFTCFSVDTITSTPIVNRSRRVPISFLFMTRTLL